MDPEEKQILLRPTVVTLPVGDPRSKAELYYGMHVIDALKQLDADSVQCVVTSPPYYGLRDYGLPPVTWQETTYRPLAGLPDVTVDAWDGCLGVEDDPTSYIGHLVQVFRELRRVLREDGTVWINIGDSYTSGGRSYRAPDRKDVKGGRVTKNWRPPQLPWMKPKDLMMIPHRVALALQADGWWVRSDIIWAKGNPMPESVMDRVTRSHEYVFLLTQSKTYQYNYDAVREAQTFGDKDRHKKRHPENWRERRSSHGTSFGGLRVWEKMKEKQDGWTCGSPKDGKRNLRSVWRINSNPYRGAHFATMPSKLARTCIKAGTTNKKCLVLDPFSGSATVGRVSLELGHDFLGIDLSNDYLDLAVSRIRGDIPTQESEPSKGGLSMFLEE